MRTTDVVRVAEINELFSRPENYDEIKEDIDDRGIQEAVVVNTNDQLLCGYTRLDIADELEFDKIPHRTVEVVDHDDMIEYAILDNIRRRQLSDLQLVEYGIKLEALYGDRQGQRTDLQSQTDNLWTDCPEVKENGNTRDIVADKIQDKTGVSMSGRKYNRLKKIVTETAPEVQSKLDKHEITQKDALALTKVEPDKQVEIIQSGLSIERSVKKTIERSSTLEKIKHNSQNEIPPTVDIRHGDFREVMTEMPDNSVDLILTDPPYDEDTIPLYEDLGRLSARVLKEGASLITYVGHYAMPEVTQLLNKHLRYWWIISIKNDGQSARLPGKWIFAEWKPMLWYVKESRGTKAYVADFMKSEREKDYHDWQQAQTEFVYYIDKLTEPGDTVVDPFAGSGTTLIAAYKRQRRAIGIEIDEDTVEIMKGRFAEMIQDTG